jgi:hypothetical protein
VQTYSKKKDLAEEIREQVQELLDEMVQLDKKLAEAKEQLLDQEKIGPLVERLSGLGSSYDRYSVAAELVRVREDARRVRGSLRTQGGRKEIDDLIAAVTGALRRLGGG